MGTNLQLKYQDILVETDEEARADYEFDPRSQLAEPLGPEVPAEDRDVGANVDTGYTLEEVAGDRTYTSHSDMKIVQSPPRLIPKKHVVIIDTAHRDWTKQINAYQPSFYFNTLGVNDSSTIIKTPIYENNKTVPYSAIENEGKIVGQLNAIRRIRPDKPITYRTETVYNNRGVAFTQQVINPECYYGFSVKLDNGKIEYFQTYDKDAGLGRIVTYESVANEYIENFSTRQTLTNVVSIRLARAVLPNRKFLNFNSSIYNVGDAVSSFASEPYLLLKVNNFQGYYNGGNDPVTSAFSVLTQNQRNVQTSLGNQFQDYYPLIDEAYTFNAPLSYIPKFDITLMKNTGSIFQQIDDIAITSMSYENSINLYDRKAAILKCTIKRTSATTSSFKFNVNELRPGDCIQFHKKTLAKIISHEGVAKSPAYRSLFLWLLNNDVTVLSNKGSSTGDLNNAYETEFTFIYNPINAFGSINNENDMIASSNFPIVFSSDITDKTTIPKLNLSLLEDHSLPIMNTNMQCMFSFEVITMEPDIKELGGSAAR